MLFESKQYDLFGGNQCNPITETNVAYTYKTNSRLAKLSPAKTYIMQILLKSDNSILIYNICVYWLAAFCFRMLNLQFKKTYGKSLT